MTLWGGGCPHDQPQGVSSPTGLLGSGMSLPTKITPDPTTSVLSRPTIPTVLTGQRLPIQVRHLLYETSVIYAEMVQEAPMLRSRTAYVVNT